MKQRSKNATTASMHDKFELRLKFSRLFMKEELHEEKTLCCQKNLLISEIWHHLKTQVNTKVLVIHLEDEITATCF